MNWKRTDPLIPSAPLPDGIGHIERPNPDAIDRELKRQSVELLWALHRQRQAWAKMERVKHELDDRDVEFIDNERIWKLATSDVAWWRGEVTSRANAVMALQSLAAVTPVKIMPPTYTTGFPSRGSVPHETEQSAHRQTVRETVLDWDPDSEPTSTQVTAARLWMDLSGGHPRGSATDLARLRKLLERAGLPNLPQA